MVDRLKGKVALVVGAGSIGPGWGNGKATAVTFAREGARVFCADINPTAAEETAGIIRSEGGEAVAYRADVSKAADVTAMVEACASAYGCIDVLDNNVGVAEVGGVVEVSESDWDRVFAVNLKSAYLTMKQTIPLMVRQGGGSIINISSTPRSVTLVFPVLPITHRRPRSTNSPGQPPSNMRTGGLG
jgi:NAD(P)-dependent dehydrogenase (short-subunit alcohol dehydrogenase family)